MGDDGQNPFWIIAIIVIAFINWLSESLKKRQGAKRAEQERQEYIRQKANQPVKSNEPKFEKPAPQSEAREEIMNFFESLTGRPSPAKPKPEPTPVPASAPLPVLPPKSPVFNAGKKKETLRRRTRPATRRGNSIRALLSSPGAARQAFILKEVLDTPKSLQE